MKGYDYAKCGKYYRYLFLMVIPSLIIGVVLNKRIVGNYPALVTAGIILRALLSLVCSYFIWQLRTEDERYSKAAILNACTAVLAAVQNFLAPEQYALSIILSLVGLALGIFHAMNIYPANADVLSQPDPTLSAKWLNIKKYYLIMAGASCASVVLIFTPFLLMVAALVVVVMALVVYIMELTAYNSSSKVCALYAEAAGRPEDEAPVN